MELKRINLKSVIGKYKYAILILVIGIVLMILPGTVSTKRETQTDQKEITQTERDIREELETILGYIDGAGNVRVMLKEANGAETIYQSDEDSTVSDNSTTTRTDVITVTDGNRGEYGLIRQINPPKYMGAVVLCQGADEPSVKLAIVHAVSKITGLGADKIAVLKMK